MTTESIPQEAEDRIVARTTRAVGKVIFCSVAAAGCVLGLLLSVVFYLYDAWILSVIMLAPVAFLAYSYTNADEILPEVSSGVE